MSFVVFLALVRHLEVGIGLQALAVGYVAANVVGVHNVYLNLLVVVLYSLVLLMAKVVAVMVEIIVVL